MYIYVKRMKRNNTQSVCPTSGNKPLVCWLVNADKKRIAFNFLKTFLAPLHFLKSFILQAVSAHWFVA